MAVLKSLHDDLDRAVLDAYGWRDHPADEQILERLVALNTERAAEEAQGLVRWLRPEFQNPRGATQAGLGVSQVTICDSHEEPATPQVPPPATQAWPQTLPEQIAALANALTPAPQTETELAARFAGKGRWKARLPELLATLATLGRARRLEDGRWVG